MSVVESAREQLLSNGSWSVDPAHSTVELRVKHMMIQTVPEVSFHAAGMHLDRDGRHSALPGEPAIKGVIRPILLGGELRNPS
jgi:polyisoprenoid-binding protein YceI